MTGTAIPDDDNDTVSWPLATLPNVEPSLSDTESEENVDVPERRPSWEDIFVDFQKLFLAMFTPGAVDAFLIQFFIPTWRWFFIYWGLVLVPVYTLVYKRSNWAKFVRWLRRT